MRERFALFIYPIGRWFNGNKKMNTHGEHGGRHLSCLLLDLSSSWDEIDQDWFHRSQSDSHIDL